MECKHGTMGFEAKAPRMQVGAKENPGLTCAFNLLQLLLNLQIFFVITFQRPFIFKHGFAVPENYLGLMEPIYMIWKSLP